MFPRSADAIKKSNEIQKTLNKLLNQLAQYYYVSEQLPIKGNASQMISRLSQEIMDAITNLQELDNFILDTELDKK